MASFQNNFQVTGRFRKNFQVTGRFRKNFQVTGSFRNNLESPEAIRRSYTISKWYYKSSRETSFWIFFTSKKDSQKLWKLLAPFQRITAIKIGIRQKKSLFLLGIHRVSGDKLRIPVLLPCKRYYKNKEKKILFVSYSLVRLLTEEVVKYDYTVRYTFLFISINIIFY
jgi:hypothetical protein